eukprot:4684803-Alexandrium_andersonii.AAC.1
MPRAACGLPCSCPAVLAPRTRSQSTFAAASVAVVVVGGPRHVSHSAQPHAAACSTQHAACRL